MLMTLSGPDIQRPLLRDGSKGIGVLECGTGGVKVELGALCMSPSMCVRQGREEAGGGLGQIVHGPHPFGRG